MTNWNDALFVQTDLFLRPLGAIKAAAFLAVIDAGGIECSPYDGVTNAREILYPASTHQYDAVLLQVMSFPGDVADHLQPIGQANLGHLPQSRIWLFGGCGVYPGADTPLLGIRLQGTRLAFVFHLLATFPDQLIDCWHN